MKFKPGDKVRVSSGYPMGEKFNKYDNFLIGLEGVVKSFIEKLDWYEVDLRKSELEESSFCYFYEEELEHV